MDIAKVVPLIHVVRGQRVMLDEDLARVYGVPTHQLNQQVQRNLSSFPADFMFRMTREETLSLRSQIVILERAGRGRYRKYWPLAFTREGISMLSTVLRSPRGVEVKIAIMRAFVKMSDVLMSGEGLAARIEKAEKALLGLEKEQGEHAAAIHELFAEFRRLADGEA
ncbi:MAG: ORF6N domain-containing protein [Elusimicrobia bacterium]|nr:ORF6N domain-containing protein [Elusimicrobiota bacterium]